MCILRIENIKIIFILCIFFLLISCSEKEDASGFEPLYLNSYQEIYSLSKEQILTQFNNLGLFPAEYSWLIRNDVKGYRIVYNTTSPKSELILTSGALVIPNNSYGLPLLSIQHGTIIDNTSAPSNFNSEFNDLANIFASLGYIIILPDYIGYGISSSINHPYEHQISLATACRDMLRATYEYFEIINNSRKTSKLFLTGYSEGGFATMATFKLIQEEHSDEFNIAGVTVGAGAYNKSAFMEWIISSNEPLTHINSYVWVLDVYNSIYPQLQRPYTFYFNEPWATSIATHGVFTYIESNPNILLTEDFISGVINGTDTDFLSAIADNNCHSWLPQSPLKLYHGSDDIYVPYFNSQAAYEAMINLGATGVDLVTIENGTHESAVLDYFMGTFSFFQSLMVN